MEMKEDCKQVRVILTNQFGMLLYTNALETMLTSAFTQQPDTNATDSEFQLV